MANDRFTRSLRSSFLYGASALVSAFEAISINSVLVGQPAWGALQALGLFGACLGGVVWFLAPPVDRHRFLARLFLAFSIFAVVSLILLQGKVNEFRSEGTFAAEVAFAPTLLVLAGQFALALLYFWKSKPSSPLPPQDGSKVAWWSWAPALLFVPIVLLAAIVGKKPVEANRADELSNASSESVSAPAGGEETYSRFPNSEDFSFATETPRAGEDFGGSFVHYHTGRRPLLGVTFSTREWHRDLRVSSDLRGIFDRGAPRSGELTLLAQPGYAVAAMEAQVDDNMRSFRLRFARIQGDRLDLTDGYWSDWACGRQRGGRIESLGGSGDPVLGLTGTSGLVVNSLGLLIGKPGVGATLR